MVCQETLLIVTLYTLSYSSKGLTEWDGAQVVRFVFSVVNHSLNGIDYQVFAMYVQPSLDFAKNHD